MEDENFLWFSLGLLYFCQAFQEKIFMDLLLARFLFAVLEQIQSQIIAVLIGL